MRKLIAGMVAVLLAAVSAFPVQAISAQSAIVVDASTGRVLYEKNGFTPMAMASTTKIMTAVVAIENMPLDTKIKIPAEAVGIEGSSIYLCKDEILTLEELLYALLLASANDAATAIAIAVGGSVENFADMMNETAKRLGLRNTHFENPHGLDGESHYTTAEDLARLAAYALTLPTFRQITSTYKKSISFDNKENGRLVVNHNKLLRSYEGAIGVKTGFTKKSGRCLVSAAERNGVTLIAVTLNAPDDWRDHTILLDYGFENYEAVTLGDFCIDMPLISGKKMAVCCSAKGTVTVLLPKKRGEIVSRVEMYPFVYAPVDKDEKLGEIVYYLDCKEIARIDVVSNETIELSSQKYTVWDKIFNKNKD
jgi:D-alanyl-D-alanine carboxypeptidase